MYERKLIRGWKEEEDEVGENKYEKREERERRKPSSR